jgi:endonuclease YncB( thermonuclease family)
MRAIFTKILLLLLLTLPVAPVVANTCNLDLPISQQKNVTRVKVDSVIDGDTLRLQNNELVRFIGINTPEIDHEAGNSQPLAEAARDFLQTLIDQQQGSILIQYDKELEDRHGRQLAHIFTLGGENIQALLIARGLGVWITVPPNLQYLDCYRWREQQARQQQRGIWAAQFRAPRDTASLTRQDRGFIWMRGKVTRIGHGKKYIWLNFGESVAAQVHKDDLRYFTDASFDMLKDKTIAIKGWLFPYKKQMVMRLRHPASLEVMD